MKIIIMENIKLEEINEYASELVNCCLCDETNASIAIGEMFVIKHNNGNKMCICSNCLHEVQDNFLKISREIKNKLILDSIED